MQFQTRLTRFYSTLLCDMTRLLTVLYNSMYPLYTMHCSTLAGKFQCNAAQWDLCSLPHFSFTTKHF